MDSAGAPASRRVDPAAAERHEGAAATASGAPLARRWGGSYNALVLIVHLGSIATNIGHGRLAMCVY